MKKESFNVEKCGYYTQEIFAFVLNLFNGIFMISSQESCDVYNDPNSECPMLITNKIPISIRLSIPSDDLWAKTIYQISHELTHYVLRQNKRDKAIILKWFEETLCESFSLYILFIGAQNWRKCSLSKIDKNYYLHIGNYLNEELSKRGDKVLTCRTVNCLKEVNDKAEEKREWRYDIRNKAFELFKKCPEEISKILDYSKYINNEKYIVDFIKWNENSQSSTFIEGLSCLQPSID